MLDDEQLERRMRDWNRAELAACEAEKAARTAAGPSGDAVETLAQRASRLRRMADAILASIVDDIRVAGRQSPAMNRSESHAP